MVLLTAGKKNKGFTMIEMMIIIAIIGILAAVTIPIYMSYLQKSRIKILVYPGLHIIQSNIALYYASTGSFPDTVHLPEMLVDSDTTHFNVGISGDELVITIDAPAKTSKLSKLNNMTMFLRPDTHDLKIRTWALRGSLANYLGINTE